MGDAPGHVALLATGGTISAGPDGPLGAASLIRLAASGTEGIPAAIPVRGEDIDRIPSSRVTAASIEQLASAIRGALDRSGCLGVVVTHGTDTMEEVAFACELLLGDLDRPVVFTGAMVPPKKQGTDAHANLARAIRVAGCTEPTIQSVVVVMQHGIHASIEVRKLSTESTDAFASPALGPIGWVSADAVEHVRTAPRIGIATSHLEPRVDLIRLAAGADDRLVRAAADSARGLVIELFGAGNAPDAVTDAIRDATDSGVTVLVCSRVGLGGLTPESGVLQAGGIPAVVRTATGPPVVLDGLKARILLMATLGADLDRSGIERLLQTDPHDRG